MALIPVRKPRPFAGRKGQSLKELYSGTQDTKGIISIKPLSIQPNRYNTQAIALVKEPERIGQFPETRTVVYNRLDLLTVFSYVNKEFKNNFIIETDKELVHPLSSKDVLKVLNGQFGCDFDENDLDIVNTCCTEYTLTAKPNSLGYIGQIVVCIGRELIFDCSGAPHITEEFEMVGRFKVELSNGKVFEGTIEEIAAQMRNTDTNGVQVLIS